MHPQLTLDLAHDAQQRRLDEARHHRATGAPEPSPAPTEPQLPGSRLATVLHLARRVTARLSPGRRTRRTA